MGNHSSKDKNRNFTNIHEFIKDLKFLGYKGKKFQTCLKKKPPIGFDYSNPVSLFRWDQHKLEDIHIIHYAGAKASEEGLQFLLNSGIDVNLRTSSGLTCLHFAVVFGNIKIIDDLIYANAEINAKDYVHGYTSLHFACKLKEINIVKKLLHHNAKFSILDKQHNLPLNIAENVGSKPIVELLNYHSLQASKRDYEERSFIIETQGGSSGYNTFVTELSDHNFHSSRGHHQFNAEFRSSYKLYDRSSQFTYPEADLIRENYEYFLHHMNHARDITNKLFTRGHVTLRFKEELKNKLDHDQNEELLVFIMKANKEKFIAFIAALQETGQDELASLLITNDQDAATVVFYQQQNVASFTEQQKSNGLRMSAVINQDGFLIQNGQVLMVPDSSYQSDQAGCLNTSHSYVNFPQHLPSLSLPSLSRQNSTKFLHENQSSQSVSGFHQNYCNQNRNSFPMVQPECQNYIPESDMTGFISEDDRNLMDQREGMPIRGDFNASYNEASIINIFSDAEMMAHQLRSSVAV